MTTLNLQVAAGADDAEESQNGTGFSSSGTAININANTASSSRQVAGFRFTSVSIDPGSTIDAAVFKPVCLGTKADDVLVDIHAEDEDDAVNFSTNADVIDRVRTTASVNWSATAIGTGEKSSPDCKAVIQEVTDRGGWLSGNALMLLLVGGSSTNRAFQVASEENSTSAAAKLDIDYTAGGGGDPEGSLIRGKLIRGGLLRGGVLT